MTSRHLYILVAAVCLVVVVPPALADTCVWISQLDGSWATAANWDNCSFAKAQSDDIARHPTQNSRIEVKALEECDTFEGNGTNDAARYLLVEATKEFKTADGGGGMFANPSTDNFVVQMQSGTSASSKTKLTVRGTVSDVDIKKASGSSGDYASISVTSASADPSVTSSSILLAPGNNGDLTIDGGLADTGLQVGDNWNIVIGASGSGSVSGSGTIERFFVGDGNNDSVVDVIVNGNFSNRTVSLGTTAGTSQTRLLVDIDSVGSITTGEDWVLRGFVDLVVGAPIVGGDFTAASNTAPVISQHNSAKITTYGFTNKGTWDLFNTSQYIGNGQIQRGIWSLANDSMVIAAAGILTDATTTWNINSDGNGAGTFGLDVCGSILGSGTSSAFNVGTPTAVGTVNVDGECLGDIDQGAWVIKNASSSVVGTGACDIKGSSSWVVEGGKIEADRIGTDNGGNHAVWALTLKNGGRLLARQDTWHLKSNPAGSGNGTFTYEGTGNVYELTAVGDDLENSIGLESEIKNVGGTSAVEIKMTANGNYQNIKMPGNVTLLDPYDLEGITLTMKELSSPQVSTIEATGPDYTCYWYGADCGVVLPSNVLNYPCNSGDPCDVLGNPVIFSDSPAVPLWGKIKVEDSGSPSILKRTMADHNQSTPISGDPGDGATTYRDALYAMIITVGKSAIVRNYDDFAACGGSGECSDPVSIYYDDCDIECNAAISGCPASVKCNSTIPSSCECGLLDMCDIPCNPSIPDCPASVKCNTPMPAGCECDAQKARIHREATVTKYGDFDGDKGTVTDADDLAFFNGRFPTSLVQPAPADWPCGGNGEPVCEQYNPLADYNADGLVDCTDWRKFVCYRQGEQTGLGNDLSCSTSSCP